ncbi:putative lipid II flippase MurJ [endosymbiont of Euscepes postfasciatus]|uniref:murein biosynthesis integral membrane protein MurJ n=1 Tax=endosymbiont of Euscepes postfasciatus TaxID=650377 RepID=UPI000DC6D3A3|nr:murein biosynthesis integral membrane protein MurJ [endosymbiont of Euscepes postfasciatus]BBA84631.1 putative lipid II flippase MurJ [endosymbiont of Euscepes postfasciatus]
MNLLKPLIYVSLATFISKILGFIRDIIIARTFGATVMTDAFFISFKLINLLRRIFAEGVFFQVFIPILINYKKNFDLDSTKKFISYVLGMLIVSLSIIIFLGIVFSPNILKITAPGFVNTDFKFSLSTKILRITFPFILIISLSSIFSAILNTWNMFFIPAFSAIFLNGSMIFFTIFSNKISNPPVLSLAWSVIVGGILQIIYQLIYLKNINMLILPKFTLNDNGIWIMFNKMWPVLISMSIHQMSIIFNTIFTSFLSSGSVSWMYYADRIMEFPSGILGIALNTILFPSLSRSVTNKDEEEYSKSLDWGLRLCFILSIPISFALIILSKPIVFSMFQYGKFSYFDAIMTQKALIAYSIGLIGIILVKILTPSFYSHQDTKTPLKVSLISFFATQILNFILIAKLEHIGLSLSMGITACFNSALLYWYLIKKGLFIPKNGWKQFFKKIIISVFIMSLSLIIILEYMPDWEIGGILSRLSRLIFIILFGFLIYILSLLSLGFRLKDFSYTSKYKN